MPTGGVGVVGALCVDADVPLRVGVPVGVDAVGDPPQAAVKPPASRTTTTIGAFILAALLV